MGGAAGETQLMLAEDDTWDAGELGCGDLVIGLRKRLRAMPGKTLKLVARDPGASEDLPSFCRMTGDTLVHVEPAAHTYWIKARG